MFTRKLIVMVLPLLMCGAVCLLLTLLGGAGFFYYLLGGLALGILLALLLPLSGATSRREPFGTLLWVPAALLTLTVVYQYLHMQGILQLPVLSVLAVSQPSTVLVECAFIGFLAATCFRTKVY